MTSRGVLLVALISALVFVALPAGAASLTTVKSGLWTDPTVWSSGSLPADGDELTVSNGDTLVVDTVVASGAGTIIVRANALLEITETGVLHRTLPNSTIQWIDVFGGLLLRGEVSSEDSAGAGVDDLLIRGRLGSDISIQGESFADRNVVEILASAAPTLRLRLDAPLAQGDAVQVQGGWYDKAHHPVASSAGDVLELADGRLAPRRAVQFAVADSFAIDATGLVAHRLDGALAVFDGNRTARILAALPSADGNSIVGFLDQPLFGAGADSVDLLESIYPGATLKPYRSAKIFGGATDPSDSLAASALLFGGGLDARWFSIARVGHPENAVTVLGDHGLLTLRDGTIRDYHSRYAVILSAGVVPASPTTLRLEGTVIRGANGINDGDWGHSIRFNDLGLEDRLEVVRCGARATYDDFVFIVQGESVLLQDVWAVDSLGGNLVDTRQTAVDLDITVRRCRVIGYGETAVLADQGSARWLLEDNLFSRTGSALNRDTVVGHNLSTSVLHGVFVRDVESFDSQRDTILWSGASGIFLDASGSAQVTVRDAVLGANGQWRTYAGITPMATAAFVSSPLVGSASATDSMRVLHPTIRPHPTRSQPQSGANPYNSWAMGFTEGTYALRGVDYDGTPELNAGLMPVVRIAGTAGVALTRGDWHFGGATGLDVDSDPGSAGLLELERNVFRGSADLAVLRRATRARFNTFVRGSASPSVDMRSPGIEFVANALMDSVVGTPPLQFASAADTVASIVDWNAISTGSSAVVRVGLSDLSAATWALAHDLEGVALDSSPAGWNSWVTDLEAVVPLLAGPLVDRVSDPDFALDPDGSAPDVGAISIDTFPVSAPGLGSRFSLRIATQDDGLVRIRWQRTDPGPLVLDIHDLRGRRVATLETRANEVASGSTVWTGRDRRGASVAAGVYFVRARSGSDVALGRIVRLAR